MLSANKQKTKTKQKNNQKEAAEFARGYPYTYLYSDRYIYFLKKEKSLLILEGSSLSIAGGYCVAVGGGGLLQFVVLEPVEGGGVALRGGAKQLLRPGRCPARSRRLPAVSFALAA